MAGSPLRLRGLPLAALLTLAVAGGAEAAGVGNPPVFHCDKESVAEREEEIALIRGDYLPGLTNPAYDVDARDERVAEMTARLRELELGMSSCKELRQVEKAQRTPSRPKAPMREPSLSPLETDDLIAPAEPPRSSEALETDDLIAPADDATRSPLETDDLIAPADDLPAPAPKPAKPAANPKRSTNPPMAPFPAPVGTPKF